MRVPFLFAGVMDKPRRLLEAYDFLNRAPLFGTPEEAVAWLDKNHPGLTKVQAEGLEFGTAIATSRPRNAVVVESVEAEADGVD